ncbi:MAG TPA: DUF4157 domain-containing protein [Kofleriaceae bacterium]|nr:DUF4157 domain-containing protein [Kofleriaceae bacterium]
MKGWMMGREWLHRGSHDEPRELDWYRAAQALQIPFEQAREIYTRALDLSRHRGLEVEEIYIALLRAEATARQANPGRRTLVSAATDERHGDLRRGSPRGSPAPGRRTRTPFAEDEADAAQASSWTRFVADPRFYRAKHEAQLEILALTLDAFAAGTLSDPAAISALLSPVPPRASAPTARSAVGRSVPDLFATGGRPVARPEPSALAWEASGAALRVVSHRRAATILRHEQGDGAADLHDPAIHEALDRMRQGAPLPGAILHDMEARLGANFGQVRIHTDDVAARAAAALHAKAFTLGSDIFFAAGALDASSESGQRLLVHELTHVIQAQQGRVPSTLTTSVSQPGDALEQEAAAAYDRTPRDLRSAKELPRPTPVTSGSSRPGLLLRDPEKPKAAGRDLPWLSWDSRLIIGFLDGLIRKGGKPLSAAARAKMERDFKDPVSLLKIYGGLQVGVAEGALLSIKDNLLGLAQVAEWVFWHFTPAGNVREIYEWVSDPGGKAAREREKAEREQALVKGMYQFAKALAKDPGLIAEIGEELGEAAGEYIASLRADFANAAPWDKGVMVGKGIGYVAMEIALLFIGPAEVAAKVSATATRLARGGGKAAQAILRLLKNIPALTKLLEAAGWLGKAADAAGPEAKILAHLDAAMIKEVMQEGLKAEELAELAKLDKLAAEKLLRELPAKEVLALEKKLGRAELEKLAKAHTPEEIKKLAETESLVSKANAEKLIRDSEGRPGPGKNVGHAEDHLPPDGASDQQAKLLAESRPNKANTTVFRSRRQAVQALRDIINENRAKIDALPADGKTSASGEEILSETLQGFNSRSGQPATAVEIRAITWRIVRMPDGELHLLHFAPKLTL